VAEGSVRGGNRGGAFKEGKRTREEEWIVEEAPAVYNKIDEADAAGDENEDEGTKPEALVLIREMVQKFGTRLTGSAMS